jgi:hypothetical protein
MAIWRKPDSSVTKETNPVGIFLGAFFLGPIFFWVIGEVTHGFLNLLVNLVLGLPLWFVLLGWVPGLVYACFANKIVNDKWKSKGWIREDV